MAMLITERFAPATRTPARVHVSTPTKRAQSNIALASLSSLLSKAGDRQSWLLLALVLIPVIGLIRNFLAFGFER